MDDSTEFQLNDSAEAIAREGTAVILDKKELETNSCYILGGYGFLWEAKETENEASYQCGPENVANQRGTETVPITVSMLGKDTSKDDSGDLLDADSDDFMVLTENDVPGSALNDKQPHELNVLQLKRWLACRGAPVTGKKPDLIERYSIFSTIQFILVTCTMNKLYTNM